MPFGRHRPQIDVEHVRRDARKFTAAGILFHGVPRQAEDLPQALKSTRLHAVLVWKRLRRDTGPQFGEEIVRRTIPVMSSPKAPPAEPPPPAEEVSP